MRNGAHELLAFFFLLYIFLCFGDVERSLSQTHLSGYAEGGGWEVAGSSRVEKTDDIQDMLVSEWLHVHLS